jgi:hypothetical protein
LNKVLKNHADLCQAEATVGEKGPEAGMCGLCGVDVELIEWMDGWMVVSRVGNLHQCIWVVFLLLYFISGLPHLNNRHLNHTSSPFPFCSGYFVFTVEVGVSQTTCLAVLQPLSSPDLSISTS